MHRISRRLAAPFVVALSVASFASADDLKLIQAVKAKDRAAVATLVKDRAIVNKAQADGSTALHWAVYLDDVDLVDTLIKAGANVKAVNDLGVSPIVMACQNGNAVITEHLLAAGADAKSALASGETALMFASRAGSLGAVNALIAKGADVNAKEATRSQTALMWAANNTHPEITKALLARGADVKARSQVRRRPFIMGGNRSSGSGSADAPISEVNEGGSTPLMFAARSGDLESAKLLLAAGADVNDKQGDERTALIVAVHSGH